MLSRFLPKDGNFFDLFDKQVSYVVEAARFLKELASKGTLDETFLQKMRDIEHRGDEATYEIMHHLNKTFITPFDREDIHALAKELDDVIDMIHTIVNRIRVYKLGGVDKDLLEFASVIEKSAQALATAVKGLRNLKQSKVILDSCTEVSRFENVGDSMRDTILAELFERAKNPIDVIKWKEVYEDAETVLDICEDVAHVIETIVVKQA